MAHKTSGRCRSRSIAVYPLYIFHACANAHLPVRHARQVPSATTHALWQRLSGHTRWLLCIHKNASLVYTQFCRLRLVYTHFRRLRAELCIHNARVVYAQAVDWLHSVYTSCACTNMLHMCIHISVDFALSCAYTMRELCMHEQLHCAYTSLQVLHAAHATCLQVMIFWRMVLTGVHWQHDTLIIKEKDLLANFQTCMGLQVQQ